MKRSKGFTLIELLAVIVILAIIALIATPMVLRYIDNAKTGSNDSSVNSIVRAADNYYASTLLKTDSTYPITFDLSNVDDIKKLGLKGKQPDEGILIINADGTTHLETKYDGVLYSKYAEETKVTRNDKVIGLSSVWQTDGQGKITGYNESPLQMATYDVEVFYMDYVLSAAGYAIDPKIDHSEITVYEYIESLGNPKVLLDEFNKELDQLYQVVDEAITEALEQNKTLTQNDLLGKIQTKYMENNEMKYIMELYQATQFNFDADNILGTSAYKYAYDNVITKNTYVIPNYVKHEDGTLEAITEIGPESDLMQISMLKTGKKLIISNGIKKIGDRAFYMQGFSEVVLPITIETIGEAAFAVNLLTNIKLPSRLTYIGRSAFKHNALSGELVIPKSVLTIDSSAFTADSYTLDSGEICELDANFCNSIRDKHNAITKVTFEKGSKIQTIGNGAFTGNLLTTITIPGSIKSIGYNAFNCPTLTSATIQRSKSSDLKIDSSAFGSVKPTYQS